MQKLRILIVGGGIAGAAAAVFLGRAGHEVAVIERGAGIRSSGSPVDVRGAGLRAAEALGITARLRERDTGAHTLALIDRTGAVFTAIGMRTTDDDIELARRELSEVLLDAARECAEIRYGETFAQLRLEEDAVGVVLQGGGSHRFDLVIGADGQHSTTRKALWPAGDHGADNSLGLAIATVEMPGLQLDRHTIEMCNEPGRALTLHPADGRAGAAFLFRRTGALPVEPDALRVLLRERYAGFGWRAAEALTALDGAGEFYADAVQRVRVSTWSRGRAVLLGDAASSLTILGEGSSMALAGARVLSRALGECGDLPTALRRYEHELRPLVERKQRGARLGAAFLVPQTRAGLLLRNAAARMMQRV